MLQMARKTATRVTQRVNELLYMVRKREVTIERRVAAYWGSLVLVVLAAFFALGSLFGVFGKADERFEETLRTYHEDAVDSFSSQVDVLTAQGVLLSEKASVVLSSQLRGHPVQSLSNDAAKLKDAESSLYSIVSTTLGSSPCSGAFVLLDATINTQAEGSDTSRASLYLRLANLSTNANVDQDVVCYRGIASVAREKGLEPHNRWRMEMDTASIEGYETTMRQKGGKPMYGLAWTGRMELADTWESAIMLMAPIFGNDGSTLGVCGIEMSSLYMQLSYPAYLTDYGSMVTVIAPERDGAFDLSRGVTGELSGTYLSNDDLLYADTGSAVNTYEGRSGSYVGMHTSVDLNADNEEDVSILTLVPKGSYDAAVYTDRIKVAILALILLVVSLATSIVMSRRCVKPISNALDAIRSGSLEDFERTGISEIDALASFLDSQPKATDPASLPEDVNELLSAFADRFATLTTTERLIVRMYGEGREVHEVAEALVISIHTVRKHNANIYRKLEVGSREELTLYLEIFRRCGKSADIQ